MSGSYYSVRLAHLSLTFLLLLPVTLAYGLEPKIARQVSSTTGAPAPEDTAGSSGGGAKGGSSGFLAGLDLAGFDFGIDVSGNSGTFVAPPTAQIAHFASQGVNVFRLSVGWQYLEDKAGGGLKTDFLSQYDAFVQATLKASTSPYVIIDLHNYARWNGKIIGEDGPSADQFAAVWGSIAKKYASNEKIMFGLMNEPHDISDYSNFAGALQKAVAAIRTAGAKSQYILLPGNKWSHASDYVESSLEHTSKITDPAGGTDLLIFDVHQYLDSDFSGTHTECVGDKISDTWKPLAEKLVSMKRRAFVSEIGGGNTDSCKKDLKAALAFIKEHSDAYVGFTAWAAGAFAQTYELSLTPNGDQDTAIWTAAVKPNLSVVSKRQRRQMRGRLTGHARNA